MTGVHFVKIGHPEIQLGAVSWSYNAHQKSLTGLRQTPSGINYHGKRLRSAVLRPTPLPHRSDLQSFAAQRQHASWAPAASLWTRQPLCYQTPPASHMSRPRPGTYTMPHMRFQRSERKADRLICGTQQFMQALVLSTRYRVKPSLQCFSIKTVSLCQP
jgi:hypothetical protein